MPIQEEISQRASPNRCDGRDDDDPEEIQPSITRGEHSTHRKDGNAPKIEGMDDHRSSRNAERIGAERPAKPVRSSGVLGSELWMKATLASIRSRAGVPRRQPGRDSERLKRPRSR